MSGTALTDANRGAFVHFFQIFQSEEFAATFRRCYDVKESCSHLDMGAAECLIRPACSGDFFKSLMRQETFESVYVSVQSG